MTGLGATGSKLVEPFTINLGEGVDAKLYPDSRPHCLESSDLQKGLVMAFRGKEIVGEGVGFGVPVVLYSDGQYFSSSAESWVQESSASIVGLTKVYRIDAVPVKSLGRISLGEAMVSYIDKQSMEVYLNRERLRPIMDASDMVFHALGLRINHVSKGSRGTIGVEYRIVKREINIRVDMGDLDLTNCKGILIANEQGPAFFRRYSDSSGIVLEDAEIGSWGEVTADEATISDRGEMLGFTLKRLNGAKLLRGREKRRAVSSL
jgi:hypothetical protein